MSTPAQQRLRAMVEAESEPNRHTTPPDYGMLAHLADAWQELWLDLVTYGGGSATVRALVASIRDPWATDTLGRYVVTPQNDLLLREAATWALGRLPGQAPDERLLELIDGPSALRITALRTIARRDTDFGRAVLDLELDPAGLDPVAGAVALAETGHVDAVRLLIEGLQDGPEPRAAEALGRLGVRAAAAGLEAMVRDESTMLREVAVTALGELGCPRTWPSLIGCLDDEQYEVSLAAWQALERASGLDPMHLLSIENRNQFTAVADGWWREHRDAFDGELRYRDGRPWTAELAIDDLVAARSQTLRPEAVYGLQCALEVALGERFALDPFDLSPTAFDEHLHAVRRAAALRSARPGAWRWLGEPLSDPHRWPS